MVCLGRQECDESLSNVFLDSTNKKEIKKFADFWKDFHLELAKIGCVSYHAGIGHPREMLEWTGPTYELTKNIKQLLDPNGIMNPGVL